MLRLWLQGYPNSFGPGKNNPSRVATQDVAWVRWAQLGSMPAAPNPTLGLNTFVAPTFDLGDPQFGYHTVPCEEATAMPAAAAAAHCCPFPRVCC